MCFAGEHLDHLALAAMTVNKKTESLRRLAFALHTSDSASVAHLPRLRRFSILHDDEGEDGHEKETGEIVPICK